MDELWKKCMEQFLVQLYHRSQSHESLRVYRWTLATFFEEYPKPPDRITRDDVESFLERRSTSRRNRGAAPSTATRNQRLAVLSSFYKYAATYMVPGQDGYPVPLLQRPSPTTGLRPGRPDRAYRALSHDEITRLFAAMPKDTVIGLRDRALFSAYFWTARRRSEILFLRWGDIKKTTIVEADGRRREAWEYSFYGKGHSTQRDVAELPGPAKAAIDEYLIASGRMATMTPESYIFTDTRNLPHRRGKPMGLAVVQQAIKKYAMLAGLDYTKISIHSLRHSSARERYHAGEDIRSVQHLLRHQSLATTDLYLRTLMGTSDPGAKLLEAKFGGL